MLPVIGIQSTMYRSPKLPYERDKAAFVNNKKYASILTLRMKMMGNYEYAIDDVRKNFIELSDHLKIYIEKKMMKGSSLFSISVLCIKRGYATKNHVFFLCVILLVTGYNLKAQNSYLDYHYEIIEAEQLIVEHRIEEALSRFDALFEAYDFVFVRDYKVATQLAVVSQNKTAALEYMRRAIGSGWEPEEIKKNKLAEDLFKTIPESLVDSLQKTL